MAESLSSIRKKIDGQILSRDELYSIIQDAVAGKLEKEKFAAFLVAEHIRGLNESELEHLTKAMAESGELIQFDKPTYEKHSIGGVPGNKVSLLIVPIVAAAGLLIPKTSSKAITSPSGTADSMSMLCEVAFTAEELKSIVKKAGGCIGWGGNLNIAPADDLFVNVEHELGLDPVPQMLASIMSKKLATGTKNLAIDIPKGPGTKAPTDEEASFLSNKFIKLGRKIGIKVRCGITYGGQPIGHAVGPALEAREAINALQGKGPSSFIEKSTALAGILLEMGGVVLNGEGKEFAEKILASRKASKKMSQIIGEQGGNPKIRPDEIPVGKYRESIKAPSKGFVTGVSNEAINLIAKAAGAPEDPEAGLILHWKRGSKVKKGNTLLEIYSNSESKLEEACTKARKLKPLTIEGMLLEEVPKKFLE